MPIREIMIERCHRNHPINGRVGVPLIADGWISCNGHCHVRSIIESDAITRFEHTWASNSRLCMMLLLMLLLLMLLLRT